MGRREVGVRHIHSWDIFSHMHLRGDAFLSLSPCADFGPYKCNPWTSSNPLEVLYEIKQHIVDVNSEKASTLDDWKWLGLIRELSSGGFEWEEDRLGWSRTDEDKPAKEQVGSRGPSPVWPRVLKWAAWLARDIKGCTDYILQRPWLCSRVRS